MSNGVIRKNWLILKCFMRKIISMLCVRHAERIDVEKQVIYPYFVYAVSYPDGTIERIIEHLKMRYYYREQIYNKIKNSGMQIVKEFSWYDKSPDGGREIILICKK